MTAARALIGSVSESGRMPSPASGSSRPGKPVSTRRSMPWSGDIFLAPDRGHAPYAGSGRCRRSGPGGVPPGPGKDPDLRPGSRIRPLVHPVAGELGLDLRRKRAARQTESHDPETLAGVSAPDRDTERSEFRRSLREALQALPDRQRMVVSLFEIDGLTTEEVAGMLNVSQVTVRWHLHQARRALREALERMVRMSPDLSRVCARSETRGCPAADSRKCRRTVGEHLRWGSWRRRGPAWPRFGPSGAHGGDGSRLGSCSHPGRRRRWSGRSAAACQGSDDLVGERHVRRTLPARTARSCSLRSPSPAPEISSPPI